MGEIGPDLVEWMVADDLVSSRWRQLAQGLGLASYIPSIEARRSRGRGGRSDRQRLADLLAVWMVARPDTYTVHHLLALLDRQGLKDMYEWVRLMTGQTLCKADIEALVLRQVTSVSRPHSVQSEVQPRLLRPGSAYFSLPTSPLPSRPLSQISFLAENREPASRSRGSSVSPRRTGNSWSGLSSTYVGNTCSGTSGTTVGNSCLGPYGSYLRNSCLEPSGVLVGNSCTGPHGAHVGNSCSGSSATHVGISCSGRSATNNKPALSSTTFKSSGSVYGTLYQPQYLRRIGPNSTILERSTSLAAARPEESPPPSSESDAALSRLQASIDQIRSIQEIPPPPSRVVQGPAAVTLRGQQRGGGPWTTTSRAEQQRLKRHSSYLPGDSFSRPLVEFATSTSLRRNYQSSPSSSGPQPRGFEAPGKSKVGSEKYFDNLIALIEEASSTLEI